MPMGIAGMYGEWEVVLNGPFYLYAEGLFLLLDFCLVPVVVEPDLTNCDVRMVWVFQQLLHVGQDLPVVLFDVFRMQAKHREAVVGVLIVQVEHLFDAACIDVGQEDVFYSCLLGPNDDFVTVGIELGLVDMTMRVYHFCRPMSSRAISRSICLRCSGSPTLSRHAFASS